MREGGTVVAVLARNPTGFGDMDMTGGKCAAIAQRMADMINDDTRGINESISKIILGIRKFPLYILGNSCYNI